VADEGRPPDGKGAGHGVDSVAGRSRGRVTRRGARTSSNAPAPWWLSASATRPRRSSPWSATSLPIRMRVVAVQVPPAAPAAQHPPAGRMIARPGCCCSRRWSRSIFPGTREVRPRSSALSQLASTRSDAAASATSMTSTAIPPVRRSPAWSRCRRPARFGQPQPPASRGNDETLHAALARAMTQTGQTHGAAFDLDFHAIMHFGTTSRWTPTTPPGARNAPKAVLSFCAHDTRPRNLVDASAAERVSQRGHHRARPRLMDRLEPRPHLHRWQETLQ
jgi:hypothetical protein